MSLNVLVVDDSAVMRKMVIKTLKLSGLKIGEVFEASDGQMGLTMLDEHWVDLAFVDINMPVMTGLEMLDRVRNNPETTDLRVIVVSTEGSGARIELLQAKGAGFVHKPFTPERLREQILDLIGAGDEERLEPGVAQSSGPDF